MAKKACLAIYLLLFAATLLILPHPTIAYDSKYDDWSDDLTCPLVEWNKWYNCAAGTILPQSYGRWGYVNNYAYEEEAYLGHYDLEIVIQPTQEMGNLHSNACYVLYVGLQSDASSSSNVGFQFLFWEFWYEDWKQYIMGEIHNYKYTFSVCEGEECDDWATGWLHNSTLSLRVKMQTSPDGTCTTQTVKVVTSDMERDFCSLREQNITLGEDSGYKHGFEFIWKDTSQAIGLNYLSEIHWIGHAFDLDGDWDCDIFDTVLQTAEYGETFEDCDQWFWDSNCWFADTDADFDVDINDIVTLANEYGKW